MDILFGLKKLLGMSLMSVPLILIGLLLAGFFYRKRYVKLGRILSLFSITALFILSLSPVTDALIRPLESQYPAYQGQPVDYVLVLGGGHSTANERPLSSLLNGTSLSRLTEGLMIYRANPGSKLLLSGYHGDDIESHAKAASRVAIALGVPESDIYLAEEVKDTAEEARHWVKFINGAKFALVTSAMHMPRSVYLFKKEITLQQGETKSLLASPTNFRSCEVNCLGWRSWIPKSRNLAKTDAAWHEYLGYLWARLIA